MKLRGLLVVCLSLVPLCFSLSEDDKNSACEIEQSSLQLRKFSVSKFLYGVAQTCYELGNGAVAQTKEEKREAACKIVGSLLSVAAGAIQDREIENKQRAEQEQAVKSDATRHEEKRSPSSTRLCYQPICVCPEGPSQSEDAVYRALCSLQNDQERHEAFCLLIRSGVFSREFVMRILLDIRQVLTEERATLLDFLTDSVKKNKGSNNQFKDEDGTFVDRIASQVIHDIRSRKDIVLFLHSQCVELIDLLYENIDQPKENGLSINNEQIISSHQCFISPSSQQRSDDSIN